MKNPFASALTHRTLHLSSRATALLYVSLIAAVMLTATDAANVSKGSRIPFIADADSGPELGKAEVRG